MRDLSGKATSNVLHALIAQVETLAVTAGRPSPLDKMIKLMAEETEGGPGGLPSYHLVAHENAEQAAFREALAFLRDVAATRDA